MSLRYSKILLVITAGLIGCVLLRAQSTNFVNQVNTTWKTHNASNALTFVETELSSNPSNAQVIAARAIVAANLQTWGRGASNYIAQAIQIVNVSTNYSTGQKQKLTKELQSLGNSFSALADDASEPTNSQAQWNTNAHAVIFGELGDEFPHLSTLQIFNNP